MSSLEEQKIENCEKHKITKKSFSRFLTVQVASFLPEVKF